MKKRLLASTILLGMVSFAGIALAYGGNVNARIASSTPAAHSISWSASNSLTYGDKVGCWDLRPETGTETFYSLKLKLKGTAVSTGFNSVTLVASNSGIVNSSPSFDSSTNTYTFSGLNINVTNPSREIFCVYGKYNSGMLTKIVKFSLESNGLTSTASHFIPATGYSFPMDSAEVLVTP